MEANKPQSIYAKLAQEALETRVKKGEKPYPSEKLPPELQRPGAVFVSLKKQGQLRGCIGTILPTRENLAQEIIANALHAGLEDPRFPPVTADELDELTYSIDILTEPEKVDDISQLDPRRYGVIVRSGGRSGLLLPDLEGINTAEEQLSIAKEKAGILEEEEAEIYRFQVQRHY